MCSTLIELEANSYVRKTRYSGSGLGDGTMHPAPRSADHTLWGKRLGGLPSGLRNRPSQTVPSTQPSPPPIPRRTPKSGRPRTSRAPWHRTPTRTEQLARTAAHATIAISWQAPARDENESSHRISTTPGSRSESTWYGLDPEGLASRIEAQASALEKLPSEDREDAIAEAILHTLVAARRIAIQRGDALKHPIAYARYILRARAYKLANARWKVKAPTSVAERAATTDRASFAQHIESWRDQARGVAYLLVQQSHALTECELELLDELRLDEPVRPMTHCELANRLGWSLKKLHQRIRSTAKKLAVTHDLLRLRDG